MIIGQFCDVFPPETDGVGMVVKNYTEELNRTQHCCYYISPNSPHTSPQAFPSFHYMSVKLAGGVYRAGLPVLDIPFRYKIKKTHFDIIHAHSPFIAGREAIRVSKQRNIPLIGTFHSKYYDDFYIKTHSRLLSKTGLRFVLDFYNTCDEVWAVNNATADVLRDYGYKKDIIIMPNGTNLWYPTDEEKKSASERFNLKEGTILLFVGQHNWKKNIRHIVEAVKIYASSSADFKIVFAGQGPDEDDIKELVAELGLSEKFLFTGQISDRSLLMSLYARADLLVFPSLYDNAPMVVREAAAAGTPSVLIKGSCSSEGITHEYNGFLCEDSPISIAECISRAIPLIGEVGSNARSTIPIPWSIIMTAVLARYNELIQKKLYREQKITAGN